jgi:hypothetical protein
MRAKILPWLQKPIALRLERYHLRLSPMFEEIRKNAQSFRPARWFAGVFLFPWSSGWAAVETRVTDLAGWTGPRSPCWYLK